MNKKIKLIKPTKELEQQALEYRKEHFDFGELIINGSELFDKIEDYEEWLEKVTLNSNSDTVDDSWVLTDTYFAINTTDERIIGIIDLRYYLNDFLKDLGNCGYSVRPSERNKGYATEMLRQICDIAKEHGLSELKLSVEKNNLPSVRTIQKNGGVYSYSFKFENEEADVYIINLEK